MIKQYLNLISIPNPTYRMLSLLLDDGNSLSLSEWRASGWRGLLWMFATGVPWLVAGRVVTLGRWAFLVVEVRRGEGRAGGSVDMLTSPPWTEAEPGRGEAVAAEGRVVSRREGRVVVVDWGRVVTSVSVVTSRSEPPSSLDRGVGWISAISAYLTRKFINNVHIN